MGLNPSRLRKRALRQRSGSGAGKKGRASMDPEAEGKPILTLEEITLIEMVKNSETEEELKVKNIVDPPLLVPFRPLRVLLPVSTKPLASFEGPNGSEEPFTIKLEGREVVCAQAISTYPREADGRREGDPICDAFGVSVLPDRQIVVVADGCGWGKLAQEAAEAAVSGFLRYVLAHLPRFEHSRHAAYVLARAFAHAHHAIVNGKAVEECGTTTLLGGITLRTGANSFVFVFASLGDCKAYLFKRKDRRFVDLSAANRTVQTDNRDCGGRLGPHIDGGPDTRNFAVFSCECEEGDIVMIVSDGVHDNLSPRHLGLNPEDTGHAAPSWEDVPALDKAKLVASHSTSLLLDLIAYVRGVDSDCSSSSEPASSSSSSTTTTATTPPDTTTGAPQEPAPPTPTSTPPPPATTTTAPPLPPLPEGMDEELDQATKEGVPSSPSPSPSPPPTSDDTTEATATPTNTTTTTVIRPPDPIDFEPAPSPPARSSSLNDASVPTTLTTPTTSTSASTSSITASSSSSSPPASTSNTHKHTTKELTPSELTRVLLEHCLKTNSAAAAFMRDNPGKRLPRDYSQYPGKMDHTTCLALQIGCIGGVPSTEYAPQTPLSAADESSHLGAPSSKDKKRKVRKRKSKTAVDGKDSDRESPNPSPVVEKRKEREPKPRPHSDNQPAC